MTEVNFTSQPVNSSISSTIKNKENAPPLSCLESAWKAIENFFSWLLDALCPFCWGKEKTIKITSLQTKPLKPIMEQFREIRGVIQTNETSVLPASSTFQLIEAKMEVSFLLDPLSKTPLHIQVNAIKTNFASSLKKILKLYLHESSSTPISSLVDFSKVLRFAEQEVIQFNQNLEAAVQAYNGTCISNAHKLKCESFTPNFIPVLQEFEQLWPILEQAVSICRIENLVDLPSQAKRISVDPDFSHLNKLIISLVKRLAAQPVPDIEVMCLQDTLNAFSVKFSMEPMQAIRFEDIFKSACDQFTAKLKQDVQSILFMYQEVLTFENMNQILEQAREELSQFQQEFSKKYRYLVSSSLKFPIVASVFIDLNPLLSAWQKIESLINDESTIDQKTETLSDIAIELPTNHSVYFKYPIKDAMERSLKKLESQGYLSNRQLDVTDNNDNFRFASITSALEEVKKRLGCKDTDAPEIVMDTSPDGEIGLELEEGFLEECAGEILINYNTNLLQMEPGGAETAAKLQFESYLEHIKDPKQKIVIARKIFAKFDPETAKNLEPHLKPLLCKTLWTKSKNFLISRFN